MQPQLHMTFGWRHKLIKQHDLFVQQMRARLFTQFRTSKREPRNMPKRNMSASEARQPANTTSTM